MKTLILDRKQTAIPIPNTKKIVDMYSLTESASSILNGLKVYYAKQHRRIDISDNYKEEMNKKFYEMAELCHYFGHYDSAEKLENIINKYGPILKAINQAI